MTDNREQYQGEMTAGPGGVMTDVVGVITGDLTVVTADRGDGRADVRVQYTAASGTTGPVGAAGEGRE
ncbi:hypothetical protein [Streptomyces syringium]|uniref:hypothetical protein n=1 Tax=Streptomyces syringium TaxID=76729 RepID=UPI00343E9305